MEKYQIVFEQQSDNQAIEWFKIWSTYVTQKPFTLQKINEQSIKLIQSLFEALAQGDSCIDANPQEIKTLGNLVLNADQIFPNIVAPFIYDRQSLYLYRYWALENSLAQEIIRLKQQAVSTVSLEKSDVLFSDSTQWQALQTVIENSLSIITGGPGTGKTYTLARIIAALNYAQPNLRIAMAAPTGKAAQRMKEALQNSFNDPKLNEFLTPELKEIIPITIHRLLGLGPSQQPRFNTKQPLPYDLIVVDEASMLDLSLANMLFSAIPDHARIILLGDAQQLASVDVGNVLADLQSSELLSENRINLVKSRRFKEGALIGGMAKFILQQHDAINVLEQFEQNIVSANTLKEITLSENMSDVVQLEYLPENLSNLTDLSLYYDELFFGFKNYAEAIRHFLTNEYSEKIVQNVVLAFDQYRILTATRHSFFGLMNLNLQIEQRFLNQIQQIKQGDWYVGRPVMMSYNDYQLGLSNGDIGICLKREDSISTLFEVYFPSLEKWVIANRLPKSIETAYVLTIHKSQGSEFNHTAVVLDQAAKKLLSKELLYTAITRAKSAVSLLVDKAAFQQAITEETSRKSKLLK